MVHKMKEGSKYLRFLVNGIIFLTITFTLDQFTGNLLHHYYFTKTDGPYYQTTYSLDSTRAKIIILGSSRARHHYIDQMIEDSLKASCYNTGNNGCLLFYNFGIFSSIIKRYTPKIILLDINQADIYYSSSSYDQIKLFYPYRGSRFDISELMQLNSKYEKCKFISCIYSFNSTIFPPDNFPPNSKTVIFKSEIQIPRGYTPIYGSTGKLHLQTKNVYQGSIDSNKLKIINKICEICEKKGIKLILIQSPLYIKIMDNAGAKIIQEIAIRHNAKFWNYANNSTFISNPSLFYDIRHLNNKGAELFTKDIIRRMKQ